MLKVITLILNKFIAIIKEIQYLGWAGILATFIGIMSFLPILYRITQTKDTSNFTYTNLGLALISNLLWIIFGINKDVMTSLISGILYMFIYGFILVYKLI
jgi:uncharacterized protein with PQ loop repeat